MPASSWTTSTVVGRGDLLQPHRQGGQRRPQLVRGVRGEVALGGQRRGQPLRRCASSTSDDLVDLGDAAADRRLSRDSPGPSRSALPASRGHRPAADGPAAPAARRDTEPARPTGAAASIDRRPARPSRRAERRIIEERADPAVPPRSSRQRAAQRPASASIGRSTPYQRRGDAEPAGTAHDESAGRPGAGTGEQRCRAGRRRSSVSVTDQPACTVGSVAALEPEPDAAHRGDVARLGGVVAELPAQPGDVHVEGLGRPEPARCPRPRACSCSRETTLPASRTSTRSRSNSLAVSCSSSLVEEGPSAPRGSIRTTALVGAASLARRAAAGPAPGPAARPAGTAW